jgi:hypothetical protein
MATEAKSVESYVPAVKKIPNAVFVFCFFACPRIPDSASKWQYREVREGTYREYPFIGAPDFT